MEYPYFRFRVGSDIPRQLVDNALSGMRGGRGEDVRLPFVTGDRDVAIHVSDSLVFGYCLGMGTKDSCRKRVVGLLELVAADRAPLIEKFDVRPEWLYNYPLVIHRDCIGVARGVEWDDSTLWVLSLALERYRDRGAFVFDEPLVVILDAPTPAIVLEANASRTASLVGRLGASREERVNMAASCAVRLVERLEEIDVAKIPVAEWVKEVHELHALKVMKAIVEGIVAAHRGYGYIMMTPELFEILEYGYVEASKRAPVQTAGTATLALILVETYLEYRGLAF